MSTYTSCGKQVLRDGQHFGDMLTPEDAKAVAYLLQWRDDAVYYLTPQPRPFAHGFTSPEPFAGEEVTLYVQRVRDAFDRWARGEAA